MDFWEYLKEKSKDRSFFGLDPVKPECQCHYLGCEEQVRYFYLDDGTVYERKDCGAFPPFFSLENLKLWIRDIINFRWNDENAHVIWHTVFKACENHKAEKSWWVRYKLAELGWTEKRPRGDN